jgi:D-sedoheptulose 7-phosphate isomerase
MYALAQLFESSRSSADYASRYVGRIGELLKEIDTTVIEKMIAVIEEASASGRSIFCIANGGSAAVASHFVNDLSANSLVDGRPGMRSFSLTDNVESVTAIANDAGYENIFSYQLQAYMQPGDIVIAMSVSGNSENVVRGVQYANEHGGYTMGWCGFSGGRLAKLANVTLHIPSTADEYGPVEAIFDHVSHIISGYLTMKRGRKLHH